LSQRTLVYQSYRDHDVAPWLRRCLETTRAWADSRGYDYQLIGDEIFDLAPGWFRDRAAGSKLMLTDLGRLLLARRFLEEGRERVIWIDADVLIFKPETFDVVPGPDGYVLCDELALRDFRSEGEKAVIQHGYRRNNCVMGFDRGNPFLPFYISAALQIVRHQRKLTHWSIGPSFLTSTLEFLLDSLKTDVAMMDPAIVLGLMGRLRAGADAIDQYMRLLHGEPRAVNLGGSNVGKTFSRYVIDEPAMEALVERLLRVRDLRAAALPFQG
jgi:hypothetical protein